jgi:hypothetical protein
VSQDTDPDRLSPRCTGLQQNYLDLGAQPALPGQEPSAPEGPDDGGDLGAFFKACALVICFILLWLGAGNVMSIWLPTRDEPIRQRRQSGNLKQFLIASAASIAIGYLVNFMLIWRVIAARALTERLGEAYIPGVLIVLSCLSTWILLTVFAVTLAQQPKVRQTLQKEIADYTANTEAQAFAAEQAARSLERIM